MGLLDELEKRQQPAAAAVPVVPPPAPPRPVVSGARPGRKPSPRPRKQVTLVLNLEIYTALQALLRERQLQLPEEKFSMRDLIEEAVRAHFNLGPPAPLE